MGRRVPALTPDFVTFGAVALAGRPVPTGCTGAGRAFRAPRTAAGTDKGELVLDTHLAQRRCRPTAAFSCWGHTGKATGAGTEGSAPLRCSVPARTVQVTAPRASTCRLGIVSFEAVNRAHWNLTSEL